MANIESPNPETAKPGLPHLFVNMWQDEPDFSPDEVETVVCFRRETDAKRESSTGYARYVPATELEQLRAELAAANETTKKLEVKLRSAEDERCAALHEMARARKKSEDCLDSAQQANGILGLESHNRGGQFARMYDSWRNVKRELARANETIAQLRQRDTVRPAQSLASAWWEGAQAGYGTDASDYADLVCPYESR